MVPHYGSRMCARAADGEREGGEARGTVISRGKKLHHKTRPEILETMRRKRLYHPINDKPP